MPSFPYPAALRPHHLLAALAVLWAAAPAQAIVMLDNPEPAATTQGNRTWAMSWTQRADYTDVSVMAGLRNVPADGVTALAWLTTSIGLDADPADLIASTAIDDPLLFTGLDLAAGTYYLVVQVQSGSIAAGLRGNDGSHAVTAPDVVMGPSYASPFLSFPAYGPSADFSTTSVAYLYTLTGTPVAAVPEPAAAGLFALGLAGLWAARRRRGTADQPWRFQAS